ncbi:MAG: DUF4870 domain-containing protein [Bacilli bacterium]|nr:DUF4870 domain-containing protein [Bacilli bacterium]
MAEETKKKVAKATTKGTTKKTTAAKKTATKKTATKTTTKKSATTKKAAPKTEKVVKEEIKEEVPVVETEKVEKPKVEEPKVEEKQEEKKEETKTENTTAKKTMSGLSVEAEIVLVYLISVLGLVFAFIADDKVDARAKFAYKQAGAVFIVSACLSCCMIIPLFGLMFGLANIVVFVFTIIALVKGYQGEDYKIPVIYDIANAIWKK